MILIGETQTTGIFCGNMGVKEIIVGNTTVYNRPGGYVYIELNTTKEQ